MNFSTFKQAVQQQFDSMASSDLFVVDLGRDALVDVYLNGFLNEVDRQHHNCNCCKSFLRQFGGVVALGLEKGVTTIWDVQGLPEPYQTIANKLASTVRSANILSPFVSETRKLGTDFNFQQLEDGSAKKWEHFHYELPKSKPVTKSDLIGSIVGEAKTLKQVAKRALDEITLESIDLVLELQAQGSIYRGDEFVPSVKEFRQHKAFYQDLSTEQKEIYAWLNWKSVGRFRNTMIATLIRDLDEGRDVNEAVSSYESKAFGYKRTSAIVTKAMIDKAEQTVIELGLASALLRRHATIDDVPVSEVLYLNRTVKTVEEQSIFGQLKAEAPIKPQEFKRLEEVPIDRFLTEMLPLAKSVEIYLENKHASNFMNLVTAADATAGKLFHWDNPVSWDYVGNQADSMRQRVVEAGGRVDGVFRFTHSWNELEPNQSLMDLHVFLPTHLGYKEGTHDTYGTTERVGWNNRNHVKTGGSQDVDYTQAAPAGYIPIENITFPTLSKMPEGTYTCAIHNWNFRGTGGKGTAEIEFQGQIHQYVYPATKHKQWITIAEVTLKDGVFSIDHKLPTTQNIKEVWGLKIGTFVPVKVITHSPNFWSGGNKGNKHTFFILEGAKNPDSVRGMYNEMLRPELDKHRKAFELLANKMRVPQSETQLSGLGFSSTQRADLVVKLTGQCTKLVRVKF